MDHYKLVQPEFLNHQGFLFGGYMLKWIDELAYITAMLEHPDHRFVTVALDDVVFRHRITNGQILRFDINEAKLGNTSVEYNVRVYGEETPAADDVLFETNITFVSVDEFGSKQAIDQS